MAFVRNKEIRGNKYYYFVESFKQNGKVHQKNLKYLGKVMPNKETINELHYEFSEKKIQQVIRSDLKFKPFNVLNEELEYANKLKQKFYLNINAMSPAVKNQFVKQFKTGYTYHSCSIEGNTLTQAQVNLVVNENLSIGGKKLIEIIEVKNHHEAIEYMVAENDDLCEDFIKRLHGLVTRGIKELKSDPKDPDFDPGFIEGDYRQDQRFISGADFIPVAPQLISREMKEHINFYKENKYQIHPIELASELHFKVAVTHPFTDGNGRMARLIMNFILDRSGFPMIDISVVNREKYIDALASGKSANLTNFILSELDNYINKLFN